MERQSRDEQALKCAPVLALGYGVLFDGRIRGCSRFRLDSAACREVR